MEPVRCVSSEPGAGGRITGGGDPSKSGVSQTVDGSPYNALLRDRSGFDRSCQVGKPQVSPHAGGGLRVPCPAMQGDALEDTCPLEVVGGEPCVPRDAGEHRGADFVALAEGENVIRPALTLKGTMRSFLALNRPS